MSRTETDSLGAIEVPATAYWGAQTQRSKENFRDWFTAHATRRRARFSTDQKKRRHGSMPA